MSHQKDKSELATHFQNLETMADQTAVHRKKFEFALSVFRKFVHQFRPDEKTSADETLDEVISYFQEFLAILNQNIIQTWTLPTIENPPCFVLEQLQSMFSRFSDSVRKLGQDFSDLVDPTADEWIQYNILDLRAISASFTQYLKTPGINEQIYKKVMLRLRSINEYLEENSTDSLAPRVFSPIPVHYQSWKVDYDDFIEVKEIGRGVSAHVYRGIDKRNNEQVAIKKFFFQKLNSSRFQSYQREVAVLATAQHPALLRLIGATDKTPFCIITEWMNGGTLFSAIHRPRFFSPTERTIAAFDIARGMEFLHSRKIVHRDLKTLNVLLDNNKRVKICDFGFSRFAENDTLMTSNIGTPHWMAPEVLQRGSRYTSKVDVYALGIVLWELATSETPYAAFDSQQIVYEVVHNDLRPPLPLELNPQMRDMITLCWDRDPLVRPSFDEIVNSFKKAGLAFDGSDTEAVQKYINASATEGEQLTTELNKLFKALSNGETTLSNVISTIEKTGIPHSSIEAAWSGVEKISPKPEEAGDFTKLLSYFLNTSKLGLASAMLRKMPENTIPIEIITKFVSELPTGSPDTDRNICVAACKNRAADLCSLYATSPTEIALSLEVAAVVGVDYQLRVIVVDRCVQCLSAQNPSLAAAALRCLLTLDEVRRVPLQQLEKFLTMEDPLESLALVAYSAYGDSGGRVPDSILEMELKKIDDDPRASLMLVGACSTLPAAKFILDHLSGNSENVARILVRASFHKELHEQIVAFLNNNSFSEQIDSDLRSAILI